MTIETRSTIELKDITAIEYECTHCHSKTIRLLNDEHVIPGLCGNCPSTWFADGSRESRELMMFVTMLREFPQSSVNQHVAIKLEIKNLKQEKA